MPVSYGPALRWFRAALTAAVIVQLGAVAHAMAGGLLPGARTMVPLTGVVLLACGTLLSRPASTRRVVLLLVAGQTFVHGVLTMAAGHGGDPSPASSPASSSPHLAALPTGADRRGSTFQEVVHVAPPDAASGPVVPEPVAHLLADLTGAHAPMAVAHLVAAAVVGVWLARGEQALLALLRLLVTALPALRVALTPLVGTWCGQGLTRPADARNAERDLDSLLTGRLCDAARAGTRRGPPAALPV